MTMMKSALLAGGSLAAFALAFATTATAQAQPSGETESRRMDAVVVTARRTEENIQDIPVAITALSGEQLDRLQINDVTDVAAYTAGFTFEAFSGPLTQPAIRGQTQLRLTSPVQNVATYLNGVYLQRNYMVDATLLDMERIEVVKGPQSALYGRNAFAGAINLITKKPGEEVEALASATFGSDKRRDFRASISGPIVEGVVSGLLAASTSEFDGTWTNNHPQAGAGLDTDGKVGGWDKQAFLGRLVVTPTQNLEFDVFYTKSERLIEQNPTYAIGTASAIYPFNTINCSPRAAPTIVVTPGGPTVGDSPAGPFTPVQNRLYCGEIGVNPLAIRGTGIAAPPFYNVAPAAEARLPGVVVDPRAYGLRGPTEVFSAKATWDITDAWTAFYQFGRTESSIKARGGSQRDPLNFTLPFPPTAFPIGGTFFDSSGTDSAFEGDQHEIRISYEPGGRFRAFFGGYYAETSDIESNANEVGAPNSVVAPIALLPVVVGAAPPPNRSTYALREEEISSLFAFLEFKATDALTVTLEGRYTQEDATLKDLLTCNATNPAALTAISAALQRIPRATGERCSDYPAASAPIVSATPFTLARSSDYFTPRLTVDWAWSTTSRLYGSIAQGIKSGGLNGQLPFAGQRTYADEENWTYEVGSKNEFLGGALRLNGAVFYTDWTNLQNNAVQLRADGLPNVGLGIIPTTTGIAGGVDVWGAEVEGVWALNDYFTLNFALAYNDPTYKDGTISQRFRLNSSCDGVVCPLSGDISGNQLERVAKWDGNVGLAYQRTLENGWDVYSRVDATYRSRMFADEMNLSWAPEITLVDGSIGVRSGMIDVQLWGKNLLDEEYVASSLFLIGTGGARSATYAPFLGEKRTYGVTVTVRR